MSRPPRILHLRAGNFVGGPEKQILRHAVTERNGPFQITLGTFHGKDEGHAFLEAIAREGLPSVALPSGLLRRENAFSALRNLLEEREIGLLCTHGYKADILGILAARAVGTPVVSFLRGWTGEDWKVRNYEAINRMLLAAATRVVCLSQTQAARLGQRRSLAKKVRVVPNAVEFRDVTPDQRASARQQLCARFGAADCAPIVSMGGRLSPEKGAPFFLKAIPEILRRHPSAQFIVFGDGALKESLINLTSDLAITPRVCFAGFVPNFHDLLPGFDVLVNPSLSEEMPNVVLESMAAGIPIVATNVGAVSEMAGPGRTIELVPPGQPSAIAHAVVGLLDSPRDAVQLGQEARQRVRQAFSPARQRACLLALYEEVIHGRPAERVYEDLSSTGPQAVERQLLENHPEDVSLPLISVVVPVRNEEKSLRGVLKNLLAQDYPAGRYEILVVDGNSTDSTAQIVEETARTASPKICLLSNPRRLSSAGRNVGVRNSSGELIVFVDGHCQIPGRKLLKDTAELFRTTNADCLCRPQPLTTAENSWFQRVVADVRASALGHGLDSTIFSTELEGYVSPMSSGASYRRSVFDRVGYYDERLDACEDVEFNYRVFRAGLRSYISPRLTIQYQPRNSLAELWKQMRRYGRGRLRYMRIHKEAFSVAQTLPAIFILWLLFGSIAAFTSKPIAFVSISSLALYLGIVLGSTLRLAIRNGWRYLLAAPGTYLTIHFGLGFGFLEEATLSQLLLRSSRPKPSDQTNVPALLDKSHSSVPNRIIYRLTALTNRDQSSRQALVRPAAAPNTELRETGPFASALTVDVEDYFHTEAMAAVVSREEWERMPSRVETSTYRLFELFDRHNVKATFFFLGWVAKRFPSLVRQAVAKGHEAGCHSFWHRPIYGLSLQEFRSDTVRAKEAIEDAGGVRVRGYRAPSFSMVRGTEWAADVLAELGFDYDSSVHPVRHDLYSNPSASRVPGRIAGGAMIELPIATARIGGSNLPIGGGGYLRILPYAYTHWGLSRFKRLESQPAVVYLHPWEIDPNQPRLKAPPKARFRQYSGLGTMEAKLTRLLQDFSFAPVVTVFGELLKEEGAYDCNSRFEALPNTQSVR